MGVQVQCPCGHRMEAEADRLGREGVCERCRRRFLFWPVEERSTKGAAACWYLKAGDTEFGPFEPADLRRFVAEGRIRPDTSVRKGEDGTWTTAQKVRGLLDAPRVAVAPAAVVPSRRRAPEEPRGRARKRDWAAQLASQPILVGAMALGLVVIGVLAMLLANRGDDGPPAAPAAPVAKAPSAKPPKAPAERRGTTAARDSAPRPDEPAPAPKTPGRLTPEQIVARASPVVAVVSGSQGSGTGFLVGKGLLVTNRHVIDDELLPRVRVHWPDGGRELRGSYGVQLHYADPDLDLAFLRVEVEAEALPLAAEPTLARGQEVIVIGSPGVGGGAIVQNAISRGLLGARAVFDGQAYWQIDAAVNPGNSGGPVLDQRGHVIGVVTLKAMGQDGLGFCLPLDAVRASLGRAGQVTERARALMVANHRLRVTSRALLRCSGVYAMAGDHYAQAMQDSIDRGEDINIGLRKAMAQVQETVHRIDAMVMTLLRDEAQRVIGDRDLPETTRERYGRLWETYLGLKGHVEGPSGTFDSWKKTLERLANRRGVLVGEFRLHEKIDVEDE